MKMKLMRRHRIGIGLIMLGVGALGILRYICHDFFCCGGESGRKISQRDEGKGGVLLKPYVLQPSSEVLKALEERKGCSKMAKDSQLYGLSLAPDLGTERLLLRGMDEGDGDALVEGFSDYNTIYMLAFMPWPFDRKRTLTYMKNLAWHMEHGKSLYWAIALPKENQLVGVIGLTLEFEHNKAEMHFWVLERHRRKGYMTEAAKRIIDYVFRDLKMNRLEINHLTVNKASQRVVEKCGFTLECEKEGCCKKGDAYEDMKFYRIMRREYPGID